LSTEPVQVSVTVVCVTPETVRLVGTDGGVVSTETSASVVTKSGSEKAEWLSDVSRALTVKE
jgi:hypothetical protein